MTNKHLSILQINTSDMGGGAEKVALELHNNYLCRHHNSFLIVGRKKNNFPGVCEIPETIWSSSWRKLTNLSNKPLESINNKIGKIFIICLADPWRCYTEAMGYENYHYPSSRRIIDELLPDRDIVHLHNLHGNYFDLRYLSSMSLTIPTIITLHDEYLYTGHCAYTLGCNRWKQGCGNCPHLDVYPAIKRDATKRNWRVKKDILAKADIALVSPSNWLASRVKHSYLKDKEVHVIPNGVDLNVFKPGNQNLVRKVLNLPQNAFILLYSASRGRTSKFKDYEMLDRVVARLGDKQHVKPIVFLALGGKNKTKKVIKGNIFIEIPFIEDQAMVVNYFKACDLYIHTSQADNFPLVILEAMACGKPTIATNAGGIPEQVRDGINGYIVSIGDDHKMAQRILELIRSREKLIHFGEEALKIAQKEYGIINMVDAYLQLYEEFQKKWKQKNAF